MTSPRVTASRTGKLQRLFELAAGQAGHFTAGQARELGYSPRSLVHHTNAGHIERLRRGFYRLVGVPRSALDDVVGAWLQFAPHGGVVSHETALALYDLAPSRSPHIHITVPRKHRPRVAQARTAVRVHTTTVPLRKEDVTRRFGVQVTAPSRTMADVTDAGGDPSVVLEASSRALATGLVSAPELQAAAKHRSARVRRLIARAIAEARERA